MNLLNIARVVYATVIVFAFAIYLLNGNGNGFLLIFAVASGSFAIILLQMTLSKVETIQTDKT